MGPRRTQEGVILFASSASPPVFRVSGSRRRSGAGHGCGRGRRSHRFPQFLPDGRRFLYLSSLQTQTRPVSTSARSTPSRTPRVTSACWPRTGRPTMPRRAGGGPGHLVFLRDKTLMAQPFDPDRLGSAERPCQSQKASILLRPSYGLFSVSDTGTLAYRSGMGEKLPVRGSTRREPEGVLGDPGEDANPRVSPDGSRIAVALGKAGARDIWIVDAARNGPAPHVRSRQRRQPCLVAGRKDHCVCVEPAGQARAVHEARRWSG